MGARHDRSCNHSATGYHSNAVQQRLGKLSAPIDLKFLLTYLLAASVQSVAY